MSPKFPQKGRWLVSNRQTADKAPFDLIKIDLRGRGGGPATGAVRARNLETRLQKVRATGPDRFVATYDIRGHRGEVEGVIRPDGTLGLSLTGTVTADLVACAADAEPAGREAADWLPAGTLRALAGAVDALCGSVDIGRGAAA